MGGAGLRPTGTPGPVDAEGTRANRWHTDVTFVRTPPKLSTLRGIVVPPYGDLPRLLHRVTVAGDAPVGVDGERGHVLEGDEAGHYTPAAA